MFIKKIIFLFLFLIIPNICYSYDDGYNYSIVLDDYDTDMTLKNCNGFSSGWNFAPVSDKISGIKFYGSTYSGTTTPILYLCKGLVDENSDVPYTNQCNGYEFIASTSCDDLIPNFSYPVVYDLYECKFDFTYNIEIDEDYFFDFCHNDTEWSNLAYYSAGDSYFNGGVYEDLSFPAPIFYPDDSPAMRVFYDPNLPYYNIMSTSTQEQFLPDTEDITTITSVKAIYKNGATEPYAYEYQFYNIPFILWIIVSVVFIWIFLNLIKSFLARIRR